MKREKLLGCVLLTMMSLLMMSCKNREVVEQYGKTENEAEQLANVEQLDSLKTAWKYYLKADSLSKICDEGISESIKHLPKKICDKAIILDAKYKKIGDIGSLHLSEDCLNLVEEIYKVIGEKSGYEVTKNKYGRVVQVTRLEQGYTIPNVNVIKKKRVELAWRYVIQGKSAINLWKKWSDEKEKKNAEFSFYKACQLDPGNQEAQSLKIKYN